ncbi:MAG: rod-binding protein [Thermoguttaceae bacterium]|nr:rod-binding protein [Thermoguttaceae bacterium]
MNSRIEAAGIGSQVRAAASPSPPASLAGKDDAELRQVFKSFVGETFFGEMLKAMRKTQGKPAYFHGGRAEEIFQQQLDQVLSEKLAESSSDSLSGPMYELFALERK